ncbi:MAG: carbon-nitrogen hydrolase family protein [Planctomycetes bacterium]|nr:carbon-nitrogen hydrolase family protein [Planctomycetota bacterium]
MKLALAQIQPGPDAQHNRERAIEAMRRAADRGANLIVFPELALSPFFPQKRKDETAAQYAEPVPGPTTEMLCAAARKHALVTVFNLYERDEAGRKFDSSPVIDADGSLLGVTRMVHITDFDWFHERDYYQPSDRGAPVYDTAIGKLGVAICYDRHYPEYMRALGVQGAQIVVIPQAGAVDEWPEGLFEAEVRVAAFQNGYFAALCNRVGAEEHVTFAGESFVADPQGRVIARAPGGEEALLLADCDLDDCARSTARKLFWQDRRPELYGEWLT